MRSTIAAALAMLALAAPLPATAEIFLTREKARIEYSALDAPFAVLFQAGFGPREYWCAAGRFAAGRVPATTRIYRLTPVPRPAGSDMVFSFTVPPGGAQPTGLAKLGRNDSLSASSARQLCTMPGTIYDE